MSSSLLAKLYALRKADEGDPWGRMIVRQVDGASAIATLSLACQPAAPNAAAVIQNLSLFVTPAAAQGVTRMSFEIFRAGIRVSGLKAQVFPGTLNTIAAMDWQGEILLPPGHSIFSFVVLTGVFASTATLDVMGFQLPLGTLQLP